MQKILAFYRRTWWIWVLFFGSTLWLAMYVAPIYWFALPGLVGYSVYFAAVRAHEDQS
jgi:hypothetical protein